MNGVYKNIAGMAVCLLLCACAERESLLPDGLIRLGTRADKSTDVRTRASVNDLAGLVTVGDRVGVYGVVTDRADRFVCRLDRRMGYRSPDEQRAYHENRRNIGHAFLGRRL